MEQPGKPMEITEEKKKKIVAWRSAATLWPFPVTTPRKAVLLSILIIHKDPGQ